MIFITGDTHNLNNIQKLYNFASENEGLKKSDYMIIAGDFGAAWSKKTLKENLDRYGAFPFTVLFVDGNHENFDILNSFPVTEWKGGKVHKLRPDIIHLMRGQVFGIEAKRFSHSAAPHQPTNIAAKRVKVGGNRKCLRLRSWTRGLRI